MKGIIKTLIGLKKFGFIKVDKTEYFFHAEDFKGHWQDLVDDFDKGDQIEVEFEPQQATKGPRASYVRRTDYPNQSV